MDEEFVKNNVLDENLMENIVTDAKIYPKVVMDLSTTKIGGWNELQPINQMSFEKFIAEDLPWWWVGIPNRDPFLVTYYLEKRSESSDQDMNKLMLLRECLCVMIHCYRRQHSADFYLLHEHPGGPASRREPMMRKNVLDTRTSVQVESHKMRSESNEYVRKTTGLFSNRLRIKIALGNFFWSMHRTYGRETACILRCRTSSLTRTLQN